jgi:hypothetical protein
MMMMMMLSSYSTVSMLIKLAQGTSLITPKALTIGLLFQKTHSTPWEHTAKLQFEISATGYANTDAFSAS